MKSLTKFGVEFHQAKLDSGARLFHFKRKGMPINIRAIFFAGSRFDRIPGTAHFLEHMLLAGTERFPAKNLIAEHIQRVGGDFSASTSTNSLRINVEIPEAIDVHIGVEILDEMLNHSLFDAKTIEKERGSIISEFKSKRSNPKEFVHEVAKRVSMQGTPLTNGNIGDLESISLISKEDLLSHKETYLTSGRVAFIASGDIEFDKLRELIGSIKFADSARFEIGEILPIVSEKKIETENYPGAREWQVILSCRTMPGDYKEYCSLKFLSVLLGEGRGSRLITKLRYNEGLIYRIQTQLIQCPDWGTFSIIFSCDKDAFKNVEEIIFQEFESLRKEGIKESELMDLKNRITKGVIRHTQTSEAWVNSHETHALFYPDEVKTISDYIDTMNSLTREDIQATIQNYLKRENFLTAICGDVEAPQS